MEPANTIKEAMQQLAERLQRPLEYRPRSSIRIEDDARRIVAQQASNRTLTDLTA